MWRCWSAGCAALSSRMTSSASVPVRPSPVPAPRPSSATRSPSWRPGSSASTSPQPTSSGKRYDVRRRARQTRPRSAHGWQRRRRRSGTNSRPTHWPSGSRSTLVCTPTMRASSPDARRPNSAMPPRSCTTRPAWRRRSAGRSCRSYCLPAHGPAIRKAVRCSPSSCISSSARATPSTPPWNPQRSASSPPSTSAAHPTGPRDSRCSRWRSVASAAKSSSS